ncbi:hypothetical protein L484_010866 [Morus notabilis]|uniref:Malectin-like domain-containing protein n=1 Tax=Morus notabilis TaxID=981085 RepID=W9T095_9ROSA|nr:hypothetical protein L484_010866 [Morus notabilis]
MENYWTTVILVFLLAAIPASFQYYSDVVAAYNRIAIDCGATKITWDNITTYAWETDDRYIQSGENKLVSISTTRDEMKTLRSFPSGLKNCYNLPLKTLSKYLLRAGFLYGNYDNLQKPPAFGLEVQGNSMNVTVATSLSNDTIYHEFIFTTRKKGNVDVCLVQTQVNQVPFISSLEAKAIDLENSYRFMTENVALYLQSRINYGANSSVPERFAYYVDPYFRVWKPELVPRYRNIDNGFGPITWEWTEIENDPPNVVLDSAIVATNASDSESIFLPINFREKYRVTACFILYFDVSPVQQFVEETSKLDIFIDGQLLNTTQIPRVNRRVVVSMCPVNITGGTANLTISSADNATSPPFLNAIEVYSVIGVSKAAPSSTSLSVLGTFFGLLMCSLHVFL